MAPAIVEIADRCSGSAAKILVSQGFNCFSWRPVLTDGPREMLWADPDFSSGVKAPAYSGIPLLFPFAGRILGASYTYEGRDYSLEPDDGNGNAIHGLVYAAPWRLVQQTVNGVVGEFQPSIDDESLLSRWPSDFCLTASYEVRGQALLSTFRCQNTGDGRMPYSFGTHAYFRLPLADGSDPESTHVFVPGTETWEEDGLIFTGRKTPATGALDLRGGPLAGRNLDHYITGLACDEDGLVRTRLTDISGKRSVTQTFDQSFVHCVVYTPPHREAICLEPWTSLADAFSLERAGISTGVRILEPGEVWETSIRLDVSER